MTETLPVTPDLDDASTAEQQVFRPFLDPCDADFTDKMKVAVYDIVLSRNMHSQTHTAACYKFRNDKCRFKFPRRLVPMTTFDPVTGVIEIQRDHQWLNVYHKWLAMMTHANHDVQILFTKNHALAVIYYVMKYISKPELAIHSKLMISAAIRKGLVPDSQDDNVAKKFLLKTYNKIDAMSK